MSSSTVLRPVWRRFVPRHASRAAEHVRAGGAAAIVHDDKRIDMWLPVGADGRISELGHWAVLALEQRLWRRVPEGPGKGLASARVGKHSIDAVLDWCERDGALEGPTRKLELDCLDCGACCHDSNVLLDADDLERFREGGRPDLTTSRYVKRSRDGKLTLRWAAPGPCQHLQSDNKCQIYALRPFNCSVFPVGSEACLAARESTLSLRDDGAIG